MSMSSSVDTLLFCAVPEQELVASDLEGNSGRRWSFCPAQVCPSQNQLLLFDFLSKCDSSSLTATENFCLVRFIEVRLGSVGRTRQLF